eukprot:TRINITY_DN27479_c0_g1_i2.p2 TRINITY_DN27479_c0_g1~~TRINITY_DN27479_c0_g1_i2.p2  ORF type:complete len:278 (-),score=35.25 TRINITY_DN27479_c0_g1_i2:150-983(-)
MRESWILRRPKEPCSFPKKLQTVFGELRPKPMDDPSQMMQNCVLNVCQPGNRLLSAGYVLYSSSTMLVLTIGEGVYGFTLDPLIGEFVMSHPDIKVPEEGKIYSFNEGNYQLWSDEVKAYIDSLKQPEKWGGKPYSARYIGSLVGDFHRTLLYGGIYGYPGDSKNANGKLRLLYECAPMSYIAEQAGGAGSTGLQRVMDVEPEKVHQRVPLFVGSKKEVEYLESFTKKQDAFGGLLCSSLGRYQSAARGRAQRYDASPHKEQRGAFCECFECGFGGR